MIPVGLREGFAIACYVLTPGFGFTIRQSSQIDRAGPVFRVTRSLSAWTAEARLSGPC